MPSILILVYILMNVRSSNNIHFGPDTRAQWTVENENEPFGPLWKTDKLQMSHFGRADLNQIFRLDRHYS